MVYTDFLAKKSQDSTLYGFTSPALPGFLFDFQQSLVDWALRKGRAAIFADCGLGKTPMQLVWAQQIVERTNRPVLILSPLAVAQQTVAEGQKFGIEVIRSRQGEKPPGARILVTNYERLHHFDPEDFAGVVCDESSILKHFTGATQTAVTRFLLKMPYRLLCTATAAPNDYIELGTSAEALGEIAYSDMLSRFFRQSDNKPHLMQQIKDEKTLKHAPEYYQKLAYRVAQQISQWRLKGHAVQPFWRWVSSWARACRRPSDLGFPDGEFLLPPLIEKEHTVESVAPPEGMLFTLQAFGLKEEREERRRTLKDRCRYVASLVDHGRPAVVWCHMNDEGLLLDTMIPDAVEIAGRHSDEEKEERYEGFRNGQVRVLVIKPKIGAWGLNWQHCADVVTFASHSYEQYYQAIRRCWRFGQQSAVTVHIVGTPGEERIKANMERKSKAADAMFTALVQEMQHAERIERTSKETTPITTPQWLKETLC